MTTDKISSLALLVMAATMDSIFKQQPPTDTASRSRRVLRANAIKMSLPGLTRQSICFEKSLAM
jgi:hypothetical protein